MENNNTVTLVGRLSSEPKTKQAGNSTVCNANMAVNRTRKIQGQQQAPIWWKIEAWGKNGETIQNYVRRGDEVLVVGSMDTSVWQDRDSRDRTDLILKVQQVRLLRNKRDDNPAPQSTASSGDWAAPGPEDDWNTWDEVGAADEALPI